MTSVGRVLSNRFILVTLLVIILSKYDLNGMDIGEVSSSNLSPTMTGKENDTSLANNTITFWGNLTTDNVTEMMDRFDLFDPLQNASQLENVSSEIKILPVEDRSGSCENLCGKEMVAPCSCDATCHVYKTCCEDVNETCSYLEPMARELMGNLLMDTADHTVCDKATSVFMVNKCPDNSQESQDNTIPLGDVLEVLKGMQVIYDNSTGLVFKNRYVYECYRNETEFLIPWSVIFDYSLSEIGIGLSNFTHLMSIMNVKRARFVSPSDLLPGHSCTTAIINTCTKDLEILDPNNMCGKFTSYYKLPWKKSLAITMPVYGNRYCYFCNTNRTDGKHETTIAPEKERHSEISLLMNFVAQDTFKLKVKSGHDSHWTDLTCKTQDTLPSLSPAQGSLPSLSPNSFLESSPACRINECPEQHIIVNGKCVRHTSFFILLGHPPQPFTSSGILNLVGFFTCFIENLQMRWGRVTTYSRVTGVRLLPLHVKDSIIMTRNYGNISSESFIYLMVDSYKAYDIPFAQVIKAMQQAILVFYLHHGLAYRTENNMLLFQEYVEEYVGRNNITPYGTNTPNQDKYWKGIAMENPTKFVLGALVLRKIKLDMIAPLLLTDNTAYNEALKICGYRDGKNSVSKMCFYVSDFVYIATVYKLVRETLLSQN